LQRALHPFMPFITEEIWRRVAPLAGREGPTVMLAPYPSAADFPADAAAEREVDWLQRFVLAVRQIRGEMSISPGRLIPVMFRSPLAEDRECVARNRAYLQRLAGLESLSELPEGAAPPASATALAGELTLHVPMAGLIDVRAEIERLGKRVAKLQQDLARTRTRLANPELSKAPAAVVAALNEQAVELERVIGELTAQLARLRGPQGADP
jgi:valyl-tRNA synthetase